MTESDNCRRVVVSRKRKTRPNPEPYFAPWCGGADLRFLSPRPDTRLHCETTDAGLVHRGLCLFRRQLSLVRIAPTRGGMARLSWPGWVVWLNVETVCPRTVRQLLAWRRVTSLMRPTMLWLSAKSRELAADSGSPTVWVVSIFLGCGHLGGKMVLAVAILDAGL